MVGIACLAPPLPRLSLEDTGEGWKEVDVTVKITYIAKKRVSSPSPVPPPLVGEEGWIELLKISKLYELDITTKPYSPVTPTGGTP